MDNVTSAIERSERAPVGVPFQPGNPGRPKGTVGGRAAALATLDRVIRTEANQKMLAKAFQIEFAKNPIRFFKTIIMPLLPRDVQLKLGEEGAIQWVRLSTMFPTKDSAQSTPVPNDSERCAVADAGERPCALPPNCWIGPGGKPQETTDG